MNSTPRGNRLQVGFFGRVNSGKSTLLNLLVGQDIAITSPQPGTTTDVVEKAMELLPLGPVLLLDTAGSDDASSLGELRQSRTSRAFSRSDIAVLVVESNRLGQTELDIAERCRTAKTPLIVVVTKIDLATPDEEFLEWLHDLSAHVICVSAIDRKGAEAFVNSLKAALIELAPADYLKAPSLIGDLIPTNGVVLLVVPIDMEAPKGRLILPQVQTIREALDNDALVLVVKDTELQQALRTLNRKPDLVVCDSQAVMKVMAEVPPDVRCTTFSIVFSRAKGEIEESARGAAQLELLKPADKVLIAEGCAHHALADDIGRVKIPKWLQESVGAPLQIDVVSGCSFPANLSDYAVVIHCGACVLNRKEMLGRINEAKRAGVPITNYGMAISVTQGVIRRALAPFPSALEAYESQLQQNRAAEVVQA